MTRKIRVTVEIDIDDLPQSARDELGDNVNFLKDDAPTDIDGGEDDEADFLEPIPRLEDYGQGEIADGVREVLEGLADYDTQAELWAGSSLYFCFSKISVKEVDFL